MQNGGGGEHERPYTNKSYNSEDLSIIQPVPHALGRHWLVQGTHSRNVHIGEVLAEKHAVRNKLLAFII